MTEPIKISEAMALRKQSRQQPPAIFVGRDAELERLRSELERLRLAVICGVPGVGKSALLLRASRELAQRWNARLVYHVCAEAESMLTVAAAALGNVAGDPVDEMARAALGQPLVLALDDAHRANSVLLEALQHLAQRGLSLWILLASREALPLSPVAIDHTVMRLSPFDAEQANLLWQELSLMYGKPTIALAEVAGAGATTPLRLKQAFAGPLIPRSDDPLGLDSLDRADRAVLKQLVAFRRPVPPEAVGAAPGLERLLVRFLVESTEGRLWVHDLVRSAVRESAHPPGAIEHARALAWWRAHPTDDDVAIEQLHHAIEVGETEAAQATLHRYSTDPQRLLSTYSVVDQHLAQSIDDLGKRVTLSREVRFLRAMIRGRQGNARQAFEELRPLQDDLIAALAFGAVGVAVNQLDQALPVLERVRKDAKAEPLFRLIALGFEVGALTYEGQLADARSLIEEGAPLYAATGTIGVGIREALTGILFHESEEHIKAAEHLAAASAALAPASELLGTSLSLIDSLERAVKASLGVRPREHAVGLFGEVPFFRYAARLSMLEELVALGEFREAAELGASLIQSARSLGNRRLEELALLFTVEAERILGRLDEGRARLSRNTDQWTRRGKARLAAVRARFLLQAGDAASALSTAVEALRTLHNAPGTRARLHGTAALAAAAAGRSLRSQRTGGPTRTCDAALAVLDHAEALLWRDRLEDAHSLLAPLVEGTGAWRYVSGRATLLRAEIALRSGDIESAAGWLAGARALAEQGGWATEATRALLVGAALARVRGEDADAEALLRESLARAEASGLPTEATCARVALGRAPRLSASDLGHRLAVRLHLDKPLSFLLRDSDGRRLLASSEQCKREGYDLFVDLVNQRVQVGRRKVDFGRRSILMHLLRSLAGHPGQTVSSEQLARDVWQIDYHPLRHSGRLTVALSRLRQLLGPGMVESRPDGYRLVAERWAVLDRRQR